MNDALTVIAKLNELRLVIRETDLTGGELNEKIQEITSVTPGNDVDAAVLSGVRGIVTELVTKFKRAAAKSAIAAFSFSELEGVQLVFETLGYRSGLIVSARIAEQTGVARTVVVSALKKLDTAGIIESRSLGTKGTHIKIFNEIFIDELKKLR